MDLTIPLDRGSSALLSHQVGRAIADLISDGALAPNVRMPPTRDLARQLGVGRTTVVDAYAWLADNGYVASRQGSGTVVRDLLLTAGNPAARAQIDAPPAGPIAPAPQVSVDFRPGMPDLELFPRRQWERSLVRALRRLESSHLGYGDPLGHERLRRAIANYLQRSRGLTVDWRTIVITAGAAQAVDILLRTLPEHRDLVIEAPAPFALKTLPATYGVTLHEIPVDEAGLRTEFLPAGKRPRLAYVAPSHQLPMGCVMSMERRMALIAWAIASDAYVIEDDYDSEFTFNGRPPPPLAKLASADRVIYCGTFSKTLAPGLRLGFMVAPRALLPRINDLKWWTDRGGSIVEQDALAAWLEEGLLERHIARMRRIYESRFNAVVTALREHLPGRVRILGRPAGMHLAVLIQSERSRDEVVRSARSRGVGVHPVEGSATPHRPDELEFVLGFGNVRDEDIVPGIRILAAAVQLRSSRDDRLDSV